MIEIEIHSEIFTVKEFRRNYKRCRQCHARTGTDILSVDPIPFEPPNRLYLRPEAEIRIENTHAEVNLLVVCEQCGRRWIPSKGITLRALGM